VLSVDVPRETVIVLDALRKQRNQSDYAGDLITDAAAAECLANARQLLAHVEAWLDRERPDLRSR